MSDISSASPWKDWKAVVFQADPFLQEAVGDLGVGGMPVSEIISIGVVGADIAGEDEVAVGDYFVSSNT
jgi:hypothetical protein